MKIAIGSEHAGQDYRDRLCTWLRDNNYEVIEFKETIEVVGYPAVADLTCGAVMEKKADLGILICGTGIGMCMAAGKVPGVRAALCTDTYMGRMAKQHNNANIICFGSRVIGFEDMLDILTVFLHEEYQGGRHDIRLNNLKLLESKYLKE